MTIAEQVADLQNRIAAAQRERMRAEAAHDAAKASAAQARADLERDFGVRTAAEAQRRLADLTTELELIIAGISEELNKVGV